MSTDHVSTGHDPYPGPPWTRPSWTRLSALLVALVQVVGSTAAARQQTDRAALDAVGYALLLLGPALLLLRDRYPGPVSYTHL